MNNSIYGIYGIYGICYMVYICRALLVLAVDELMRYRSSDASISLNDLAILWR